MRNHTPAYLSEITNFFVLHLFSFFVLHLGRYNLAHPQTVFQLVCSRMQILFARKIGENVKRNMLSEGLLWRLQATQELVCAFIHFLCHLRQHTVPCSGCSVPTLLFIMFSLFI